MMDNLMSARECLHLAEVAEYLSDKFGRSVKEHEVLDFASARKLKVSLLFEQTGFARMVSPHRAEQAVSLLLEDDAIGPTISCKGVWDLATFATGLTMLRNQLNLRLGRRDLLQPQPKGAGGRSRIYVERDGALYRLLELSKPGNWLEHIDDPAAFIPAWHLPEGAALVVRPGELVRFAEEVNRLQSPTAPVAPGLTSMGDEIENAFDPTTDAPWHVRVQIEATKRAEAMLKAGGVPRKNNLAPGLVDWCRDNGVKPPSGICPSDQTIRKVGLKGWNPPGK